MTSSLIETLGSIKGSLSLQLLAAAVVICLVPLTLLVDGLQALSTSIIRRSTRRTLRANCPRGHTVELVGTWKCPTCQLTHESHAFTRCPHCGDHTHAILCACGLPVENPLSPVRR